MAKYFPPLEKRGKTEIIDKKRVVLVAVNISPHDKIPRNEEHGKIIIRIAPSTPHFFYYGTKYGKMVV